MTTKRLDLKQEQAIELSTDAIEVLDTRGLLVTCEPKERLERIQPGILADMLASMGENVLVMDPQGQPRGTAKIDFRAVTTFGQPHPLLLNGGGFGQMEVDEFQQQYGQFFRANFPELKLSPQTVLVLSVYRRM